MWTFVCPRIVFGENSLDYLQRVKGKKAFIVTDGTMISLGYASLVQDMLKRGGIDSVVFGEVEPEPSFETVNRGRDILAESDCDLIVGLGGGSVMDAAKAIRVIYEMPEIRVEDIAPMMDIELEKTKLILIPTTSGTGSEVTTAIVLTDRAEERKAPTVHVNVGADLAIIDPVFIEKLPKQLIADTGMDALSHAVDAYISDWKNDFSDGLAIKALEMIFKYLPRSYKDPADKEAKEKMHIAATLAGLSFGNAQAGLSHTIGHSVGAVFHIPHGRACGISLPYTIQFEAKEAGEFVEELARYVGIEKKGKEAIDEFIEKIFKLMVEIEMPHSLRGVGIKRENFEAKLEKLMENEAMDSTFGTIRRLPTDEELQALSECIYEGKAVDF
jgi:alcohol dehydrogenase class IV